MPVADPGEGPGGPATPLPPLFLDQTEAPKNFLGDQAPAPLSKGRDDQTPLPHPLKVWIQHYTCILFFFSFGRKS